MKRFLYVGVFLYGVSGLASIDAMGPIRPYAARISDNFKKKEDETPFLRTKETRMDKLSSPSKAQAPSKGIRYSVDRITVDSKQSVVFNAAGKVIGMTNVSPFNEDASPYPQLVNTQTFLVVMPPN